MLNSKRCLLFNCNNRFLFFGSQIAAPFGFPYLHFIAKEYRIIWSLFPPNLLSEALKFLLDATSRHEEVGIRWSTWSDCSPNNNKCTMTIVSISNATSTNYFTIIL